MNILVVYDSQFGNTEQVARAVAELLRRQARVMLVTVDHAPRTMPRSLDLLVVGGPTQGHGASPSLRGWLDALEPVHGVRAAAFDTRFGKARWLTGSAARTIARRLDRLGFQVVGDQESFFVAHTRGPLLDGEAERAAKWTDTLTNALVLAAFIG